MHIILSHSHTDFDGLAAQYAAGRLYQSAYVVLAPQLYSNVREFVGLYREVLRFVEQAELPDQSISRITLVDTDRVWGNWDLLPDAQVVVIDHHQPPDLPDQKVHHRVQVHAGATTTLLVQRILSAGLAISPAEATLFALGIYEDTGNLTYDETTVTDVQCVAALLEHGADLQQIRRYRSQALTEEQQTAYHALLPHIKTEEIKGWQILTGWADLQQHVPDLSGLIERVRDVYQPAVLVVALGLGDGSQLIARANEEALDVGELMEQWNGGGHAAAAAAWVESAQPQQLIAEVRDQIATSLAPVTRAADMMTTTLVSLAPESTVQEALDLLRRWDYGAIPILDDQRLVGDIGRAELSKAERHQLLDAPVRRYMWRKPTTIDVSLPLRKVRQAVAHEHRGRVYVVDDQQTLQGLITRGDVLHHSELRHPPSEQDWLQKLQAAVTPQMWQYLQWAADWASQHNWGLFVVGGFVRDLVLGRQPGDLDLVVEGNAPAVAEALAAATSGHVRTHTTFRTATVTWPDDPDTHLDFITARTEFYEHPTALPFVEAASLRHDLHRRDFTINTLALALSSPHQGHLYDFYGGLRDLQQQRIRVLHNLSFIDDPTRVLRALRLVGRLEFHIESRTGDLIHDALEQEVLTRTSPIRIFHELERMLVESDARKMLALLQSWGVLKELHPLFRWDDQFDNAFKLLQQQFTTPEDVIAVGLLVLLQPLAPEQRIKWALQWTIPHQYRSYVEQWNRLEEQVSLLTPALSAGELDQRLARFEPLVLEAAQVLLPRTAQAIQLYLQDLRPTQSLLTGHHLQERLDLKPGPLFAPLLAEARRAQLDGQFSDLDSGLLWVQRYLQQHKELS